MADLTAMMQAAAGAAGGGGEYIEDVFSTYLYTGNGSTQTITNGIDLDGEGGLVWLKNRDTAPNDHILYDTDRGFGKLLRSNQNYAQATNLSGYDLTAFTSSGFSLGLPQNSDINANSKSNVSWTFRKAPKFFDVVTYTGTGANRTVSHNLGSVPGCIIVKRIDTSGDWQVYHRANTANPETDYLVLNSTAATADSDTRWNDTLPTSTVFSLGTEATVNASGGTYVAYLFAHDDGGFGDDGTENVISCGSRVDAGTVTLGYEPQWVMFKNTTDGTTNWFINDVMRGMVVPANKGAGLFPNTSGAESITGTEVQNLTATGFDINGAAGTYIYIAIRRGPMKTPTAGTEVFAPVSTSGNVTSITAGFPVDFALGKEVKNSTSYGNYAIDRLRGGSVLLETNTTGAEYTSQTFKFDSNTQFLQSGGGLIYGPSIYWLMRRAPGFFDVVCYTGTGSATTFSHNLGVVPELMIMKKRSATDDWAVYAGDNTDFLLLNTTAATADNNTYWNDTSPTSTVFSVGTNADVNTSAATYVTYLFASVPGVSKVGSYTGNGTSVSVTTGFQPRFILVKRTDSTGNWIVGDSARGLVAGDDPFLLLNSSAIEDTDEDWVDVSATGFTINETAANANVSTATYIYLAIS